MHILENPYIVISLFAVCFIGLIALGIHFAVKGVKAANGNDEKDYINLGKLEQNYKTAGKLREDRCVVYIGTSLENCDRLYSEAQLGEVFSDIKKVLLESFSIGCDGDIASRGEKNFVAVTKQTMEQGRKTVEECIAKLNQCLLKHSVLNIAEIRIGTYFAFGTEVPFDEAILRAKQAFLLAKQEKLPFAEWNLTSGKALEKKIKIENNIEKEIDNNRFFLEYQPVLDAKTKKIIGAEVLSRLNSETEGVLTPGSFLSAVDSVGLNDKFDYYIFEKNCKWISNDKKQRENYKYTINFSRATLSEPRFAEKIISIAEKYDLKFSCLAVEILEDKNVTGEAKQRMIENLSTLKEKGISVLLDDFGSGYTTFGDLQNLDVSIVKIDKAITRHSVTETGFIILKNIIQTSKDIGFKTLCEGIETKEQEEAAIKAGCDLLQGFYYYRPMPVAQLEKVFQNNTGGV